MAQIKLYIMIAVLIGTFGIGFLGGYKIEAASKQALIAKYQATQLKAVQNALDERNRQEATALIAAKQETEKQKQIAGKIKSQLQSVQQFVKGYKCITYGLIKTLNGSAVLSYNPAPLPKGKTDFDCAPIDTVKLSKNIIGNYGISNANAQQLNGLIAYLQKIQDSQPQHGKK